MRSPSNSIIYSTGIAIFAMFFGAGNVVFPLLLGQSTGTQVFWALLGLMVTAVGAPLLGLLASMLFEGDCKQFFYRIGVYPGYLLVLLILALLGPFGVMPRCFIVAYAAIKPYFPTLSLLAFSLLAGGVTLLLIARRAFLLPLLGFWLSPLLITTLLMIIGVAIFKMEHFAPSTFTPTGAFIEGLSVGYNTMDLLASIVFAVSIWLLLKEKLETSSNKAGKKALLSTYMLSSLIGGGLLGLIYVGMGFCSAVHSQALVNVAPEQALTHLSIYLLGPKLAAVANSAILLACLTTVMSLAVAIGDVIHLEMMNTKLCKRIPYHYGWMIGIMIAITVIFSNLGFAKIMYFLAPILELCYPAVIVLAICNVLYKLYGFSYVKMPFYLTLVGTVIWQLSS